MGWGWGEELRACSEGGPTVRRNRTSSAAFETTGKPSTPLPCRAQQCRQPLGSEGSAGAHLWPLSPEPQAPQSRLAHPPARHVASPIPTPPCPLALALSASAHCRSLPCCLLPQEGTPFLAGRFECPPPDQGPPPQPLSGFIPAYGSGPSGPEFGGEGATLAHSRRLLKVHGMNA